MRKKPKENKHSIPAQTVGRAVDLLRIIASSQSHNLKLIEIAAMADLDKSTAQRLLTRLVHEKLLIRDTNRGYRLGPLLYEFGLAAFPENNIQEVSQGALRKLAKSTGDMVFLVIRSGMDSVCLNRIAGDYPIQTLTRTEGDRHPLGVGAGGLAILAGMHDADIKTIIQSINLRLPKYQLNEKKLWENIFDTRLNNHIAIDRGTAALDVTAIGHPIYNKAHTPVAAVFVASVSIRMNKNRQEKIIQQLSATAQSIENLLNGYSPHF